MLSSLAHHSRKGLQCKHMQDAAVGLQSAMLQPVCLQGPMQAQSYEDERTRYSLMLRGSQSA